MNQTLSSVRDNVVANGDPPQSVLPISLNLLFFCCDIS